MVADDMVAAKQDIAIFAGSSEGEYHWFWHFKLLGPLIKSPIDLLASVIKMGSFTTAFKLQDTYDRKE
jgi:hypothetical protein